MSNFLSETNMFHLSGGSAVPSLEPQAAAGEDAEAGFGPGSSDMAGLIFLTVGSGPLDSGTLLELEFSKPYDSGIAPFMTLAPANAPAAGLSPAQAVFVNYETSSAEYVYIAVNGTRLTAGETYEWIYHVIGARAE